MKGKRSWVEGRKVWFVLYYIIFLLLLLSMIIFHFICVTDIFLIILNWSFNLGTRKAHKIPNFNFFLNQGRTTVVWNQNCVNFSVCPVWIEVRGLVKQTSQEKPKFCPTIYFSLLLSLCPLLSSTCYKWSSISKVKFVPFK